MIRHQKGCNATRQRARGELFVVDASIDDLNQLMSDEKSAIGVNNAASTTA
ncbi:MAG: hypothetical protein KF861_03665 [Planctomycetaceae bacterium]|nr:hypothetical protein [Planctomycetaceae bacterium]